MFFLSLLLRAENCCKTAFISKCWLLSGSEHVPILKQLLFFDNFLLFILQHLFQTAHFAVTSCFPAPSPAGKSVKSGCNLFSHLIFPSFLEYFCSLAHPASIFPKSGSTSSGSPSLQLWNCAADHYLIIKCGLMKYNYTSDSLVYDN